MYLTKKIHLMWCSLLLIGGLSSCGSSTPSHPTASDAGSVREGGCLTQDGAFSKDAAVPVPQDLSALGLPNLGNTCWINSALQILLEFEPWGLTTKPLLRRTEETIDAWDQRKQLQAALHRVLARLLQSRNLLLQGTAQNQSAPEQELKDLFQTMGHEYKGQSIYLSNNSAFFMRHVFAELDYKYPVQQYMWSVDDDELATDHKGGVLMASKKLGDTSQALVDSLTTQVKGTYYGLTLAPYTESYPFMLNTESGVGVVPSDPLTVGFCPWDWTPHPNTKGMQNPPTPFPQASQRHTMHLTAVINAVSGHVYVYRKDQALGWLKLDDARVTQVTWEEARKDITLHGWIVLYLHRGSAHASFSPGHPGSPRA